MAIHLESKHRCLWGKTEHVRLVWSSLTVLHRDEFTAPDKIWALEVFLVHSLGLRSMLTVKANIELSGGEGKKWNSSLCLSLWLQYFSPLSNTPHTHSYTHHIHSYTHTQKDTRTHTHALRPRPQGEGTGSELSSSRSPSHQLC